MKRSVVLSVVIGSLILVMSLGANAYQHSQIKQAQQQISRLQQQKRQVSRQLTKTNQQKGSGANSVRDDHLTSY
ncbi:hypothetical protein [Lacticaseibacillus paracasei]|uniref:hypothetical protein n=1 Tax=Lacticaseibacillus paracasei TaxID=1597 RepID=UPI000FEE2BCD|nr:hypothetical protein [Lacticaseibacillus paracasei]RND52724.1 hypothetical protein FAM18119_02669 [Lacticaseibacillus paracasei]